MNGFFALTRLGRMELFGINRLLHTPGAKGKARIRLVGISLLAVLILAGVCAYIGLFAMLMNMAGTMRAFPTFMMFITSMLTLFTVIWRAPNTLFDMRDFDMVLSLPIRTTTVAVSRLFRLYAFELIFDLGLMVPGGIIFAVVTHPSAAFYAVYLMSIFLIPLVPMAIASVLGALIKLLGATFRHSRYASLILSFVGLMGVMFCSYFVSFNAGDEVLFLNLARTLVNMTKAIYPLAGLYDSAVMGLDVGAMALFALISVCSAGLFAVLFGRNFVKWNTRVNARAVSRTQTIKRSDKHSVRHALFTRELKRYFACNIYVMNTAFGLVFSLVMVIALHFVDLNTLLSAMELTGLSDKVQPLLPLALCVLLGTACTTGSSISLEGKSLWIVRTLPVSAFDWLMSKVYVNLAIALPFALVEPPIMLFALRVTSPVYIAVSYLLSVSCVVFVSVLGLLANLYMHRFDWTNEQTIVKSSIAAFLPVLAGMLLPMGFGYLTFLYDGLDGLLMPLVLGCVYVVCTAGMLVWIFRVAEEKARTVLSK